MKLNRAETLAMNNPIRAAMQRFWEVPNLLKLGGPLPGGVALEVGCGRGVGSQMILKHFGAARVEAFDLDPAMVRRAERRLAGMGDRVKLWTGDVTHIPAPDGHYDAVFDFGIIHHVPNWRDAIAEIHRVLKPGGRFYVEEILRRFLEYWLIRTFFAHPREDRFTADDFAEALTRQGFSLVGRIDFVGWASWLVADKN